LRAMTQGHTEVVSKVFEAFNRGEYDAAAELAHPDVELVRAGDLTSHRGRAALRDWMKPQAFSDQRVELQKVEQVDDGRLLATAHLWLTGAGSGIEMDIDFWTLWSFDDSGLVTRAEIFLEHRLALEAAGFAE
jgi:ketosteroid isomerase-like protein